MKPGKVTGLPVTFCRASTPMQERTLLIIHQSALGNFIATFPVNGRGPGVLGSGHSNILENQEKIPKSTSISVLIDQFSCKNWPIKGGG